MSQRYLGGVITANPTAPTMTTESGVWTLEQQFQYSNVWSPKIVGNSLRFRSSASAYLNRTPASASNRKTWTWSGWVKRGKLGVQQGVFEAAYPSWTSLNFGSDDKLNFQLYNNPTYNTVWSTSAVFRDPSAWYHVVLVLDTTQASQTNMVRMYVNGVQQTLTYINYNSAIPQNSEWGVNYTVAHNIGAYVGSNLFDGYMAEVYFVDGQALTPSSFGAYDTNGIWQPLPYTGTYGTNGFYLTFADNSGATATTLGKDYSGNGNNWTPNNISVTSGTTYDWMLDTPTNSDNGGTGRGNYCVINPLQNGGTLTNGNLNLVGNSGSATGTVGITSGKWYWEVTVTTMGTSSYIGVSDETWFGTNSIWSYSQAWVYIGSGLKGGNGSTASYGASYTTGNVIGVALDMDAGTLTFYKDNTSQGTAFSTGISGKVMRPFLATASPSNTTLDANFGQRPFAYTPPTGFKALNTQNLPSVNINNGAQYMAATTYTGTGASLAVSNGANNPIGTTFQPDFVWMKSRSAATGHLLQDSVRGTTKYLQSNNTNAEGAASNVVTSFNSNGFTIGNDTGINTNAATYIGWQWKAGGTAVSNTSGTITSSVSANTTAGFSVVTYTGNGTAGATVGHGLGVAPAMIITKARGIVGAWSVYHQTQGASAYLSLNTTDAVTTANTTRWNGTSPTSSVFSVGTYSGTNGSTNTIVAYLFAEVAGFSKFGSYTGNGSTDGPFVYCGFRPKFVLVKRTDTSGQNWVILDTSRDTYNLSKTGLYPNLSNAEDTGWSVDILSNGFKPRDTAAAWNASGGTYIYAAFAENPFNISRAR